MAYANPLPLQLDTAAVPGCFTLLTTSIAELGWRGLAFTVQSAGQTLRLQQSQVDKVSADAAEIRGVLSKTLTVRLEIRRSPRGHGWLVTPYLRNADPAQPFAFDGYGYGAAADAAGPVHNGNRMGVPLYAHSQNLRYENLPHCRLDFPFIRPLPTEPVRIGAQASGPIPALILGSTDCDLWLLEGAFSEERHVLCWEIGLPRDGRRRLECQSRFTWTGGHPELVMPGFETRLETSLFLAFRASPDRLYELYMKELEAAYDFAGRHSRLTREPVFCTWNFDVYTNINEADCRKRMGVVAAVQQNGWFQIDHGYQKPKKKGEQASPELDDYYPDPLQAWDLERFPTGAPGFVAACRDHGLRPGIWWSPRVDKSGRIAEEHPEWLLLDTDGKRVDVGHFLLDPSVPEARQFMERCLHTITSVWGFTGIKVDFYSYMFDFPRARFRNGGTGVSWKRWLHHLVRSSVGPEGYFLHCISCPLGDPFLAMDGPDAYRAGIDIGSGEWDHHVRGTGWLLPAMLATGGGTWFGNIDSCMGKAEIPAVERRSRLALTYMTAGMLEFSGPVETLDLEALSDYRRLAERCDQGTGFECPDPDAFVGRPYAKILIRRHAPDSHTAGTLGIRATVALFNWTDQAVAAAFPLQEFGTTVKVRDFWSRKLLRPNKGILTATLPPRGSLMVDVE